ncbi:uncharacterized protein LOC114323245 [Camellia sinensis]|uniref:uncharacterized protein LOC114323245 n=1 Tax=Camellia sinensis TaxID=4442 RepID=UPI0010364754|nr:uncharacterized protein LOC114323245 [Camellia sinensis]
MRDDDETSETEEAADQHDESSESGDDDADSNSASGDEPSIGYVEGLLEVLASFEGHTFTDRAGGDRSRTISAPQSAGRERQALARGRMGCREPIMRDDDETSETEEAADQHDESSESGDDDADSNSTSGDEVELDSDTEDDDDSSFGSTSGLDSGANGDSSVESTPSRKKTKRASRA